MRLLPREEKFFHYFLSQVRLIARASGLLMSGARQGFGDTAEQIGKIEREGDEIIHEIFNKLSATFITPLDPEDIHKLASSLDDVLDGIEEAAHKISAYKVVPLPAPAVELCALIESCAAALQTAFQALSDSGPIMEQCIEINRLEDQADQITRAALADIFENEKDAIRLIKLKEIYELLEVTTDFCEDVADMLQNVVVKNS